MPTFPFVTPCCHQPLPFENLDEIAVVEHKDEDDGSSTWGINSRCCYDHRSSPKDWNLEMERKAVYKASVMAARKALEIKIEGLREAHCVDEERFADLHDPGVDRIYAAAIYGPQTANFDEGEYNTKEEAKAGFERRCNSIKMLGYVEIPDTDRTEGVFEQRSFVKDGKVLRTGYWSWPVAAWMGSGGSGYSIDNATCYN